jgi:D-alanyl-lipoteichoic acid acyltransferase DltB (MBOAT superfamily)
MLFNSIDFFIYLPLFFIGYFIFKSNLKAQNLFVLISSLIFYSFWDYRFLPLILVYIIADYYFGILIASQDIVKFRKGFLILAIIFNLLGLMFFKYFNFIIEIINYTTSNILDIRAINQNEIILPIGISFFTFHSISYLVDIYKHRVEPTKNFVAYASFVSFFPQLVAGPISRAEDMLPKFLQKREIDSEKMSQGISQITLGFFKKIVVADSIGLFVDGTYASLDVMSDFQILLSTIFYSFQIYCDFSGYTDIALGLGKIFGIEFNTNFKKPYFSKNFSEFWDRWHISLSSWLRDYLYIPLGGNKYGRLNTFKNLLITMLIGGLWHGAKINFIIWGFLHGIFLIGQRIIPIKLPNIIAVFLTFLLTSLAWVFFRSPNLGESIFIFQHIFEMKSFQLLGIFAIIKIIYLILFLLCLDLFYFEYFNKYSSKALIINTILFLHIILFASFTNNGFIYFQF